ncbi:helix-turn-helix domain-containing protein [Agromyces sp. ISL-38]|uniref:helix-turn-helix domain-containing protein n=1 Tax=Agromyces sp. ISL-38 TaxID=2819107 RepID=UPI001BE6282F|nr:helix-turn-helix domain-containing protein [Agromyces sp. ISL-38]MBT2498127.1 helix-turn-helix domain-containing protein [Agromyces sp. ISL-38]MBT2518723.1 helix-turn-helix domain-containing protein [Streptomyces sp. ISL-90]
MATTGRGSAETDAAALRLGAHIRRLRRSRGDTLVQLAELTDLSHPFLSQLERGLAQPSLSSLRRIAVALDTSPIELVAAAEDTADSAPEPPMVEVRRAGDAVPDGPGFAEGTARMLAHSDRPFHPLEYEGRNGAPGDYYVHAEDEFLYVTAGQVMVDLDGEIMMLDTGDAIYYAGGVRHRWWSEAGTFRLVVVKERPRSAAAPRTAAKRGA